MNNKEKKPTPFFKSIQISKEKKEKYFKIQKGNFIRNSPKKENEMNSNQENNKEQTSNYFFITHKNIDSNINNLNNNSLNKINDINNLNGIFMTNKNSFENNNNGINNINNINALYNINNSEENIYKSKLNIVYFESIKNLCNHLNKNFTQLIHYEKIININEFLIEMYQNLQILNRKILLLNNINNIKVEKEDLKILNILLQHLMYMNKALENDISQNIINIYSNLNNLYDNFKGSL